MPAEAVGDCPERLSDKVDNAPGSESAITRVRVNARPRIVNRRPQPWVRSGRPSGRSLVDKPEKNMLAAWGRVNDGIEALLGLKPTPTLEERIDMMLQATATNCP